MNELASAPFWPFWLGGAAVALLAVAFPLATGRWLGVSSIFDSALELLRRRSAPEPPRVSSLSELEQAMLAATEEEFGPLPADGEEAAPHDSHELGRALAGLRAPDGRARPLFLVGMVIGGALGTLASGREVQPWSLGRYFDERFGPSLWLAASVLLAAGVLIGLGTRIAGGCTSGHGVTGVACGERGSILSTLSFWGTGVAMAWLLLELT